MNVLIIKGLGAEALNPDIISKRTHITPVTINTIDNRLTTSLAVFDCNKEPPKDWADITIVAGECTVNIRGAVAVTGENINQSIIDMIMMTPDVEGEE
jgi:hypothetical protein